MNKVILFDADGVLTLPEEAFSVVYSRTHGYDPQPFEDFFQTEWREFVTGKRDLKEHIAANPDFWHWHDDPQKLIDYWCKSEDIQNSELLELIAKLRAQGIPCYVATEQEKYRTEYMRTVMFANALDGCFSTAEIGIKKSEPAFFAQLIILLQEKHSNILANDVLFFDDSQSKVDAACAAGLRAYFYSGQEQFIADLAREQISL